MKSLLVFLFLMGTAHASINSQCDVRLENFDGANSDVHPVLRRKGYGPVYGKERYLFNSWNEMRLDGKFKIITIKDLSINKIINRLEHKVNEGLETYTGVERRLLGSLPKCKLNQLDQSHNIEMAIQSLSADSSHFTKVDITRLLENNEQGYQKLVIKAQERNLDLIWSEFDSRDRDSTCRAVSTLLCPQRSHRFINPNPSTVKAKFILDEVRGGPNKCKYVILDQSGKVISESKTYSLSKFRSSCELGIEKHAAILDLVEEAIRLN